jgi:L-alanine-DL-glutamate epimerase-like enolase superfamily enzyme
VHGMGVANAHICGAIPNNDFYEQLVMSSAQIQRLATMAELPVVDGFITVPETPGLGFEPDWNHLERTALLIV